MRCRRLFALLSLLALGCCGCFGGAANPSYIPYYLPPGDVIETHAKPAGLGYFNDFDPKAASIEVTPAQCNAAVGGDHVLIATVFDADGVPRRKRRVEWILEGPGEILEVDESGILPGRGYLSSNQRAVSYTGLRAHTFGRGTRDTGDDFRVEAGQTWCILRSAKPGETVVTAYAPAIHNHDKRTATARVTWGSSGGGNARNGFDDLPPPQVVRGGDTASRRRDAEAGVPGTPAKLTLTAAAPRSAGYDKGLVLTLTAGNLGGIETTPTTVRLTLPADAEFVRSEPPPTVRTGQDLSWLVGPVAPVGKRTVSLTVRPMRKGELALVATAETADGLRADARADVTVGVATLQLYADGPDAAAAGERFAVAVTLNNAGPAPAENAIVWVSLPDGVRPVSGTSPVKLDFGTVPANGQRKLETFVEARQPGAYSVAVNLNARGGIAERKELTLNVGGNSAGPYLPAAGEPLPLEREPAKVVPLPVPTPVAKPEPVKRPALMLDSLDFPATVAEGGSGQVRVTVRNRGAADATDVSVVVAVGDGLRATGGTGADRVAAESLEGSVKFKRLDRLPPGGKAVFVADVQGVKAGPVRVEATVTAAGEPTPLREEQGLRVTGK